MKIIIAITTNTGGLVPTQDIVGRDSEINELWEILEKKGVAIFAERRFGKTSILCKMDAEPKDGFVVLYKPIEGVETIEKFSDALIDIAKEKELIDENIADKLKKGFNLATDVVPEVKGVKLGKFQNNWQKQLIILFSKLIEKNSDKIIVLMFDEFPIFIDKLIESDKETAMSVLGFFRDIAHNNYFNKKIRFIYNGSIGIDLVLDKLKNLGVNIGDPINFLTKYRLEPLTDENAIYLSKCFKLGCGLTISYNLIKDICKRTDNIPYYIDVIFDKLKKSGKNSITQKIIENAFDEIIDDTTGENSTKHFYDRIDKFYPNKNVSENILNFISKNPEWTAENDIANNILSTIEDMDRDKINKEIERLKNDGYLIRKIEADKRAYNYKYSLLKKWWLRNKAY